MTHLVSIVAGLAAPIAFEGWTTSDSGPRSKAHYAAIVNASQSPRDRVIAFGMKAFDDGKSADAVRQFFAEDAVDHAAGLTGREAIAAKAGELEWLKPGAPRKQLHVGSERGVAFAHYAVGGDAAHERVEIYRIKAGRITEHWSVVGAPSKAPQP